MKNYIPIVLALVALTVTIQAVEKGRLLTAIQNSDMPSVKKFLRRLGSVLDAADRKECFEAAEDVLDDREAHVSLLHSRSDAVQFMAGSCVGLLAMIVGIDFFLEYKHCKEVGRNPIIARNYRIAALVSSGISLYSFYKAYRGMLCSDAKELVAAARQVFEECKKAQGQHERPIPKK